MTGTWAEVDLGAIEHNFKVLKKLLAPNVKALAVCKANAYGHGIIEIAKRLEQCGADMLAVARVSEGVEMRENNIKMPVLCLGEAEPDLAELIANNNITQAVGSLDLARKLSQAALRLNKVIKVHVKLDTGMSRIGFYIPDDEDNKLKIVNEILELKKLKGLEVKGMFSHFANAEGDENYTQMQLDKFNSVKDLLISGGLELETCHIAASDALILRSNTHLDMVRMGIALYGYKSCVTGNINSELDLRPAMKLKSRIAAVRRLPKGVKIGYGCTHELTRDSVIAVLQTGYADGLPRILSNNYCVKINNIKCKILGRICMDMCMADITDLVNNNNINVEVGDEAVIYDGDLTVDAAKNAGTVIHEILCLCSSPRIKHVYFN